jgi:diketogulonate reductase-like aldo/keto reductase
MPLPRIVPPQLALAWVLSRADYIVPIPGTSHRDRLEENAAAASLNISAGIRARCSRYSRQARRAGCATPKTISPASGYDRAGSRVCRSRCPDQ